MAKKRDLHNVEKKVYGILTENGVNRVILGISGGADSVALLHSLLRCGVEVRAIHCNFHLRGEESMRDQHFVESLCIRMSVPLEMVDIYAEEYSRNHGVSLEMACRDLRYELFRDRLKQFGFDRIAVAHNSDDNIETMMLNLFRGTGIKGLTGMLPDNGEVIRPLLTVSRREIEEYLKVTRETFITDSSNKLSEYKRNYIRNELLPMIEHKWPGARKAILKTILNLRSDEELLEGYYKNNIAAESDLVRFSIIDSSDNAEWLVARFVKSKGAPGYINNEVKRAVGHRRDGRDVIGKRWNFSTGSLKFTRRGLLFEKKSKEN